MVEENSWFSIEDSYMQYSAYMPEILSEFYTIDKKGRPKNYKTWMNGVRTDQVLQHHSFKDKEKHEQSIEGNLDGTYPIYF